MRLAVAGWVENRLSIRSPDSGLMMNMWATAGLRSAASLGIWWAALSILASAEASHTGRPQISAPRRSAAYSRVRLIAICTSMAAIGATITISSEPTMPSPPLFSRLPPPKNMPNWASIEMAPAMVAVMVMIRVSRFCTCASSCAMTPAISSRDSMFRSPVVAATAAFSGLRPVAKAFGCGSSIR
ncbi:hypothetical protein RHODGE_RHODGE_01469 [Rhodoplanes serenus]|uniref:Uncharacterized protein n=1 Tax=Rhodoplanes serenus TaxID=200615 RepID=A0A3S4BF01_9BRAD|nr:hypothetical protein RHODGE_RHODGE_01469 [Rhodoplanes serenus]